MDRRIILYLLALVLYLSTRKFKCGAAADDYQNRISFPISGNVYPHGQYYVEIMIGNPPLPYTLGIDTGSDLTWVQCDAPCTNCYQGPHAPYKRLSGLDLVPSNDPICKSLGYPYIGDPRYCDYQFDYADGGGASFGFLVRDNINITLTNDTHITRQLTFGCGCNQKYAHNVFLVDGILGLGKGGSGILAQLSNMSVTQSYVAHCFSSKGGGYLSIGEAGPLLVVWKPIIKEKHHYFLGLAELMFDVDQQPTDIKELQVVFDSGSSYTYFPSLAYKALLDLIKKHLNTRLKLTTEDQTLPVCWKHDDHNFTSVGDAANHFRTLTLNFTHEKNVVQFELLPQSYLIVSDKGSACFGILNGTKVGYDEMILIGDISMQDKLVLYDNNNFKVGWAPANCTRRP